MRLKWSQNLPSFLPFFPPCLALLGLSLNNCCSFSLCMRACMQSWKKNPNEWSSCWGTQGHTAVSFLFQLGPEAAGVETSLTCLQSVLPWCLTEKVHWITMDLCHSDEDKLRRRERPDWYASSAVGGFSYQKKKSHRKKSRDVMTTGLGN